MTVEQFIETAIEGGYNNISAPELILPKSLHMLALNRLVLDPKAWKAVGKVKGWDGGHECGSCEYPGFMEDPEWHMCQMVSALCKGQTLETYIESL